MTHSNPFLGMLDTRDSTWHASVDRVPIVMACSAHTYNVARAYAPTMGLFPIAAYQACNEAPWDAR